MFNSKLKRPIKTLNYPTIWISKVLKRVKKLNDKLKFYKQYSILLNMFLYICICYLYVHNKIFSFLNELDIVLFNFELWVIFCNKLFKLIKYLENVITYVLLFFYRSWTFWISINSDWSPSSSENAPSFGLFKTPSISTTVNSQYTA